MLTELQIKNVAIIDSVTIEFGNGFNVLTGETGAGKSILIDSINMALGGRTSKDLVRTGTEYAFAQAVFDVNSEVANKLQELDIEPEDDMVILSRKITAEGKSTCKINGRTTPLSIVREIGALLLTIHGQLDNQALLVPSKHRGFVDKFADNINELENYREKYKIYRDLVKKFEALSKAETDKERRLELLKFQVEEINSAQLKAGEEEELSKRQEFLSNAEKIMLNVNEAYSSLYGDEMTSSAYDLLYTATRGLEIAGEYDERLKNYYERISSAMADIDDVTRELKSYIDDADYDQNELDFVQERLALIMSLKRKYGCADVPQLLDFGAKSLEEIETIDNLEQELESLNNKISEAENAMTEAADRLTENRARAGEELSRLIMNELEELDMKRVVFAVDIQKTDFTVDGCDNVEFLISTNPGENLKPLSKIASGGEMSRIMLAIKSILAKDDIVDTLIFDEIDTGVSGRAAQKISEKICEISRIKQVLCITHLAQIASMGDYQYLIKKAAMKPKPAQMLRCFPRLKDAMSLPALSEAFPLRTQQPRRQRKCSSRRRN